MIKPLVVKSVISDMVWAKFDDVLKAVNLSLHQNIALLKLLNLTNKTKPGVPNVTLTT